jgi:hypothetical protein
VVYTISSWAERLISEQTNRLAEVTMNLTTKNMELQKRAVSNTHRAKTIEQT